MPTLEQQLRELSGVVFELRERHDKRLANPKQSLSVAKNLLTSHEGLEAEKGPVERFGQIANAMTESLAMLSVWCKQLESDRRELIERVGSGGDRDQRVIDLEQRITLLAGRLSDAEVNHAKK